MKPNLLFLTNIPTPYQKDFFAALTEYFDLHVVYYAVSETNRQWDLDKTDPGYRVTFLPSGTLSRLFLKIDKSLHFSSSVFKTVWKSKAKFVVVGGSYHAPNTILALLLSGLKNKKVFFFTERLPFDTSLISRLGKRLLLAPVRYLSDGLLGIGNDVAESYKKYGVKVPVHFLPYNIDSTAFREERMDPEVRRRVSNEHRPKGEFIFISSGALITRKRMDFLIDVFQELMTEVDVKCKLLILGDGPEKQNLLKMITIPEQVEFVGFQQKEMVPYYYSIADVFVFASAYDGWGLVINEAISAGLPVISTDGVIAAVCLTKNGENGFVCASDDKKDFKEKMKLLLFEPALRQNMAKNNIALSQKIDSKAYAQQLFKIFTWGG